MKTILITTILLLPVLVSAQDYSLLVGIPGFDQGSQGFDGYVKALYALSISIAALLAVIKIVIAGVKLMTTDIVTTKGEAKKDIQSALIGLLVVLAAVLIIYVINPQILKVDLNLDSIAAPPAADSPGATSPSSGARISRCLIDDYEDNFNDGLCGCPFGYKEITKSISCPDVGCVGEYQLVCQPDDSQPPITRSGGGACKDTSDCWRFCRALGTADLIMDVRYMGLQDNGEKRTYPYHVTCGRTY